jgi:arabinogalactan oligomer/maltooligosaccharide transport system permease protein
MNAKKVFFVDWLFKPTRKGSRFGLAMTHVVLLFFCVLAVYPVLRILTVALRPGDRLLSTSLAIIPADWTLDNFRTVLFEKDFLRWLWNSLVITLSTAFIGVMIASTSAYAFARWNFRGKNGALIFLFATQMIPAAMMMIPLYILAVRFGLINTWRGLVVAYSVGSVPFSIWILKGYYDTIPVELEEAALIDGTSRMGAFYRIILPLSTPSLAIAFLFNFTSAWNDFLLARIILARPEMATWPLGLQRMQNLFRTEWGAFSAGALLVSIPVMILFFASSKYLVSGLTAGGVKG